MSLCGRVQNAMDSSSSYCLTVPAALAKMEMVTAEMNRRQPVEGEAFPQLAIHPEVKEMLEVSSLHPFISLCRYFLSPQDGRIAGGQLSKHPFISRLMLEVSFLSTHLFLV